MLDKYGSCCVRCGSYDNVHAHHIKPWKDFPELRFDNNNGEVLCVRCHIEEHPFMAKYGAGEKKPKKTIFEVMLGRSGVKEKLLQVKKEKKEKKRKIIESKRIRRKKRRDEDRRFIRAHIFNESHPNPNWTS